MITVMSRETPALRRDAEKNRRRILAAAREVYAQEGLDAAFEHIARRAKVGIGTLYRRFPDREALIDALFEDQLQQLVGLAEQASCADDAWNGLVRFFEDAVRMQVANRGLKDLLANRTHGLERTEQLRDRLEPLLREMVVRAQRQGALRRDVSSQDLPFIANMVASVVDVPTPVVPELWRRYLWIVLDGLRSEGGSPSTLPVRALSAEELDETMRRHRPRRDAQE